MVIYTGNVIVFEHLNVSLIRSRLGMFAMNGSV